MNDKLLAFLGWTNVISHEAFSNLYDAYDIGEYPEKYPVYTRSYIIYGDMPEESYYTFDFLYPEEIEMFLKNNPEVLK